MTKAGQNREPFPWYRAVGLLRRWFIHTEGLFLFLARTQQNSNKRLMARTITGETKKKNKKAKEKPKDEQLLGTKNFE
jgi:hypothetical protein